MTTTFHALVIKLVALTAGTLNSPVGELAPAAFYAAVHAVDPALASQLHDVQERKAFSLSPLYGYWRSPADKRIHVRPGQEGWLRLSLLDDQLFAVFMQHLLSSQHPTIRLGECHFAIHEVLGAPGSHPWVGYTTLEQLRALQPDNRNWVLSFESPTAIRWQEADNGTRRVEIFPHPRFAIASLRSRWDKLTGEAWGLEFEEWVGRNVVVNRVWHWETQTFAYQKQNYIGGQGKLEYRLLDDSNREYTAHLHHLLHLAFYTGIGYKTTHGLGQVRLVN